MRTSYSVKKLGIFTSESTWTGDEMPAKLRAALVSAGVAAVTAVSVLGAATPAFAKSNTQLSGPGVAQARHAFRLTISVGDDGGARPAWARLQVRGARGQYHWFGTPHRLRVTNSYDESYAFTLTETHPCTATFRAVVSGGYAVTSPVTVVVRSVSAPATPPPGSSSPSSGHQVANRAGLILKEMAPP